MDPQRFASVEAYNDAFPEAQIPTDPVTRNGLRGYQAAMKGLTDDISGEVAGGATLTLDFLPGGAPARGQVDRIGNVVATRWGDGPVLILAEQVSLHAAWRAVTDEWPTRLSQVRDLLSRVADEPGALRAHAD